MKIIHIITGLGDGGAEHTLYKICKYDHNNIHIVISLTGIGKYYSLLSNLGIKVYCFKINFFSLFEFFSLIKLLNSLKPNIVQTWLVHADFIGGITSRLVGIKKIIWNIRYSNLEIGKTKLTTLLIIKLLSKLSYIIPKAIVVVSKKSKLIYQILGYDKKKLIFIPNGYDLSILNNDLTRRQNFRKKIKFTKTIPVIGNVSRYDPKKDHKNLLKALSIIRSKNIEFLCILVGTNINKKNLKLMNEIKKLNLSSYVKLLDQNNDITSVMNGLDIFVQSSSYGEGFPNVVAEAMACGTPCVVTNVGDAAFIVGKTGWTVPPNNSLKLAKAIEQSLSEFRTKNWNKRRHKARLNIKEKFEISKMISSYNKVWRGVNKRYG